MRIEANPFGWAVIRVTYRTDSGEELVEETRGRDSPIRDLARRLAMRHDLVPIWEDRCWLEGRRPRPLATLYRRRHMEERMRDR